MSAITIIGKALDGDPDHYALTLYPETSTWLATSNVEAKRLFLTDRGRYLFKPIPDRGTYFSDASGTVVCFLRDLEPATAKAGQKGKGNANVVGRTLDWLVESV